MSTRRSVLLIDDSRDYCVLIERAFRRAQPATAVFPLVDGQAAIEHLVLCGNGRPVPDLVLLDRSLPGGPDGYDVLRAIRQLAPLLELPVLMISGSDDEEHVAEAREAGADGYIVKPPERDEYPMLVRQVLAWRIEESWRSPGGTASGLELATTDQALQSAGMSNKPVAASASVINIPGAPDEGAFLRTLSAVKEFLVKTFDPVDYAINEASRRHNIPVSHARGRGGDQITVRNRHRVIFDLMDTGVGDRVIAENFQLSQRALERLRAEWRVRKSGGILADGQN